MSTNSDDQIHHVGNLQDNAERFRFLVESVKDYAIFLLDPDGRVISWNAGAELIKGYAAHEIVGRHFSAFYTPEDAAGGKPARALSNAAANGRLEDEGWRVRKDGSRFWANVVITALRDDAGRLRGFAKVTRDMTERRRMEEKLQASEKELKRIAAELTRSNNELERFAYLASHDLQEPLRMVASFTQLLAIEYQDKLDDEGRGYIGYAVEGAKRMQLLINQLLEYSRLGTRRKPFEPVDCQKVYEVAVANLQVALDESGAALSCTPLPAVMGDRIELIQVFQNLLTNAIKFRRKDRPEVQLSAEDKGDDWQFAVRDNGIGIDPAYFDRLFVIFQRLHSRSEYPGTGIGLAICKKIVEKHGGRIWVESQPGQGSIFYFTIPKRAG